MVGPVSEKWTRGRIALPDPASLNKAVQALSDFFPDLGLMEFLDDF